VESRNRPTFRDGIQSDLGCRPTLVFLKYGDRVMGFPRTP
jgi:hypothetical protein